MAKKIKLSDLKVKSSVVELNQKERKAAKGGFVFVFTGGKEKVGSFSQYIADTQVDIRLHDKGGNSTEGEMHP